MIKRKNIAEQIFENIFRLGFGVAGLLLVSPIFTPKILAFFKLPTPKDPVLGLIMLAVGFFLLLLACQDPNEEPQDSCDANP